MLIRDNYGGVKGTADRLAAKQAQGWTGSKGIHSRDQRHKERRRASNAKRLPERLAKAAARSQRDQAFRLGRKLGK